MTVSIHRITRDNSGLLDAIAQDVFDHAIAAERLDAFIAAPGHALFVAVDDREVVGHIRGIVHLQPDRASDLYIDNLGVSPVQQRQGIATRLIQALVAWGRAQGCTYVWVATEPNNDGGIAFYEAQRFERQTIEFFGSALDGART
jgi:aminoglycoside 6'-N-acetyltransferase I